MTAAMRGERRAAQDGGAERVDVSVAAAVSEAYVRYYRDVYRYVLALTRSRTEAEDVTAEAFSRALESWRVTPDRPLPWLLLTSRRITTDRWRRVKVRAAKLARLSTRESGGPPSEFWIWFDAIAKVLTPRQREVLILRYQRDLTDRDIGRVLGLSESGVRSLTARALDVLRVHPEVLDERA